MEIENKTAERPRTPFAWRGKILKLIRPAPAAASEPASASKLRRKLKARIKRRVASGAVRLDPNGGPWLGQAREVMSRK